MGLFRKDKTGIRAKTHRNDIIICSHSRGGKTPSCSKINTVPVNLKMHELSFCLHVFERQKIEYLITHHYQKTADLVAKSVLL